MITLKSTQLSGGNYKRVVTGSLNLPMDLYAKIVDWCEQGYPAEACGVLVGQRDRYTKNIYSVVTADNCAPLEKRRGRFAVDPFNIVKADQMARRNGCEIIGFFHSHPDSPAIVSNRDALSAFPYYSNIIVEVAAGIAGEMVSWVKLPEGHGFFQESVNFIGGA